MLPKVAREVAYMPVNGLSPGSNVHRNSRVRIAVHDENNRAIGDEEGPSPGHPPDMPVIYNYAALFASEVIRLGVGLAGLGVINLRLGLRRIKFRICR